jgi:hypothetical protein
MMSGPSLAQLVEAGQAALLSQYGEQLRSHHHQALRAIAGCRSGALGELQLWCPGCDRTLLPLQPMPEAHADHGLSFPAQPDAALARPLIVFMTGLTARGAGDCDRLAHRFTAGGLIP